MRIRQRRMWALGAVLAGGVTLVGCTSGTPDDGSDGVGGSDRPSESVASETLPPSAWEPGAAPDPSGTVYLPPAQRGECPVDPSAPDLVTFVVTSADDATPIEVTYPAFRTDNTVQIRRVTHAGPVITVVQADCTDGITDAPWGFVATAESGSLACALFFSGRLVASDSASAEGDTRDVAADCTGHPGM